MLKNSVIEITCPICKRHNYINIENLNRAMKNNFSPKGLVKCYHCESLFEMPELKMIYHKKDDEDLLSKIRRQRSDFICNHGIDPNAIVISSDNLALLKTYSSFTNFSTSELSSVMGMLVIPTIGEHILKVGFIQ